MKKRILSLLTALALCLTLLPVPVLAAENSLPVTGIPWSGSGTEADPYQISNKDELIDFANAVNSGNTSICAKLTADIGVNEDVLDDNGNLISNSSGRTTWTPIGNYDRPFNGTFDGSGHTVSGLYFNDTSVGYVGLFGRLGSRGTIKNVGVVDSYLKGKIQVGGVCGYSSGTITNCYNTGAVSGTSYVGGVCGNSSGTITNCYNTGAVTGTINFVGGVCGENFNGTIENCYNTGAVTGNKYVGGVCGDNSGTIEDCYYLDTSCGSPGGGESKTGDQFASGEVACLLQGSSTEQVWGQNLTSSVPAGMADPLPALGAGHLKVIQTDVGYTNALQPGADGVYQIGSAAELYFFAAAVNGGDTFAGKTVTLTADIVVNKNVLAADGTPNSGPFEKWTPIGVYVNGNFDEPFKGTFDGGGHTVSGLYCEGSEISVGEISSLAGLFGSLGENGTIKNVGVTDSYFKAMISAGVCAMSSGTIENCWNESTVAGFEYFEDPGYSMGFAGGVCGMNTGGSIKGCRNTGKVSASGSYCFAGGVCGASSAKIENCYNTGTVSVTGDANSYIVAGGICAGNDAEGKSAYIENCYNTGTVSITGGANSYAGGVCGSNDGTIENCFYLEGTCDSSDEGTSKTAKEFASGEVAYLLQGEQASQVWGQTIGKDQIPVLLALLFGEEQPEKIYRVTFMNSTDEEYAVLYANSGASLTKPADPTKDNYTFDGWFTEETYTTAWDFDSDTVSDDLTLYAKWTAVSYTVTFDSQGGSDVSSQTINTGEKAVKPSDPTWSGHTFDGWYTDAECKTPWDFDDPVTANITLYAKWTEKSGGGGGGSYIPTYPPTVEVPGGGGTVTVSPSRPGTGDEVTVKPKPDTGFLVDKVTVTDKDGKPVPVTQNPDGTYSFTQPSGKVKIEVSYKPAEAPWENPYTDVSETAWYFDSVRYVSVHGLMEGYGDGRFGPDDDLSRAQLAQILYNHAGQPDTDGESSFTDVTGDAWYTDAVTWAAENGIVSGYGGGLFGPDDSITREQLAVMLYRYAGRPAVPNLILPFRDANKASAYAMDALRWAVDAGILNGKGNGILDPTGKATRAEVAAMLMRYCEAFGK